MSAGKHGAVERRVPCHLLTEHNPPQEQQVVVTAMDGRVVLVAPDNDDRTVAFTPIEVELLLGAVRAAQHDAAEQAADHVNQQPPNYQGET